MKRSLLSAVMAALVVVATGVGVGAVDAEAQVVDRRASEFDLGLYAGAAVTSAWWSEDGGDGRPWRIGGAPMFGGQATWWFNPNWGVRLHTGLMVSPFPEPERSLFDFSDWTPHDGGNDDGRPLNNWFYDLNIAARPWIADPNVGNFLANTYFFLGAGALSTSIGGYNEERCTGAQPGVCLSRSWRHATVGQGTLGAGFNLVPLTPGIGLFGELALHGYSAPVHTSPGWQHPGPGPEGQDHFALTTRGVLGLMFSFGDLMPAPPPAPPVAPTPPPAPAPVERAITVCVVDGTMLREVEALFLPETNDTVVVVAGERRPFRQVYPTDEQYAATHNWYIQDRPITFRDQRYVKFGLTRIVAPGDLQHIGFYEGVTVWADSALDIAAGEAPEVIYVPVRPGCEFQPYQAEEEIRVRG